MNAPFVVLIAIAWASTGEPPPSTEAVDGGGEPAREPAPSSESAPIDEAVEPPTLEALVENAERLLQKGKHALALEQAKLTLDEGGLGVGLHARARIVEGEAHLALGDVEAARESLAVAILCGATLPSTNDPIARGVHEAAALRARETPVVLHVGVAPTKIPGLVVTVVDDPAERVEIVRVWSRSTSGSEANAAQASAPPTEHAAAWSDEPSHFFSVTEAGPVLFVERFDDETPLRLEAADLAGNALVEVDLTTPPSPAVVEKESAPSRFVLGPHLITAAGGAVVLLGVVGMATAGTLAALADRGSSTFTPDTKTPLLVGVAAAFGVVLAGGAVVVGGEVWRMIREDASVDDASPDGA